MLRALARSASPDLSAHDRGARFSVNSDSTSARRAGALHSGRSILGQLRARYRTRLPNHWSEPRKSAGARADHDEYRVSTGIDVIWVLLTGQAGEDRSV